MDVFAFDLTLIFMLLALGVFSGLAAGLLGIGGGIILVPGIIAILNTFDFPQTYLAHTAIATTLAVIIPSGISAALAHAKHNAFDRSFFIVLMPGIAIGALAAPFVSTSLQSRTLIIIFAACILALAIWMQVRPHLKKRTARNKEPYKRAFLKHTAIGLGIGFISALIGIGGATLSVPYMNLKSLPIHKAIGTAAALGVGIALCASLSFFLSHVLNVQIQAPHMIGFVFWPAWIVITISAALSAPIGAWLAHKVETNALKKIFSFFMILVAVKLIYNLL